MGQAALSEAALYDAAAGAALPELMTSLLRVAPSGDAAAEAALQAAVQSLSACQQQESLRLQRSVASLRSDLRERSRLRGLDRQPEIISVDEDEAVATEGGVDTYRPDARNLEDCVKSIGERWQVPHGDSHGLPSTALGHHLDEPAWSLHREAGDWFLHRDSTGLE